MSTKHALAGASTLLAILAGAGCAKLPNQAGHLPTVEPTVTASKPPCAAGTVTVEDGDTVPCDLVGGRNTLTVRFSGADGYDDEYVRGRCDNMGGTFRLVWTAGVATAECDRVDF